MLPFYYLCGRLLALIRNLIIYLQAKVITLQIPPRLVPIKIILQIDPRTYRRVAISQSYKCCSSNITKTKLVNLFAKQKIKCCENFSHGLK